MAVKVTYAHGVHKSGTKEYRLLLLRSSYDGTASLLVKNWGKVGAAGQTKPEIFRLGARSKVETAYNKAIAERFSKGYLMRALDRTVNDLSELRTFIQHPMVSAIPVHLLQEVHPGFDSGFGAAAAEKVAAIARQQEEARQTEIEAERQILQSNPLFGMFG